MLAHEGTKRCKELLDLVYRRETGRPNAIRQDGHTTATPSSAPPRSLHLGLKIFKGGGYKL